MNRSSIDFNFISEPTELLLNNFKLLIKKMEAPSTITFDNLDQIQIKIESINEQITKLNDQLENFLHQSWNDGSIQIDETEYQLFIEWKHRCEVMEAFKPYVVAYSTIIRHRKND